MDLKRLLIILCIALSVPFLCFAEDSGWTAGFSIDSEGFIAAPAFNDAEYVGINLFLEPWTFPFLTPSISAGAVVPVVPHDFEAGLITAELGFELFNLRRHPFSWIIDLENSWAPLLSLRMMLPFEQVNFSMSPDSFYLSAVFAPFRLKTGSGRFSLFSLAYMTDFNLAHAGWGIRMFDFRLYLL